MVTIKILIFSVTFSPLPPLMCKSKIIMASIQQLQTTLRYTYGLVPIVAGLDKFTNMLTNWPDYLGSFANMIPFEPPVFMAIVGVIEIVAGIIVLARPVIGAYIVMAWLICIALQLIMATHFYDVAVRDLVMALGAYTLAQLTRHTAAK